MSWLLNTLGYPYLFELVFGLDICSRVGSQDHMVTVFSLRALHTVLHNALITELEIHLFLILKVLVEGLIFGNFVLNRTDDFS